MNGIVYALVHRRHHIVILLADSNDFRDLPRKVVAEAPPAELALLVQLVDRLERHLVWRRPVGRVQVPEVDRAKARGVRQGSACVRAGVLSLEGLQ